MEIKNEKYVRIFIDLYFFLNKNIIHIIYIYIAKKVIIIFLIFEFPILFRTR